MIGVGFSQAPASRRWPRPSPGQRSSSSTGGQVAQRRIGDLQGARGQLPVGYHARSRCQQATGVRLRRRHGHPADPQSSSAATSRAPSYANPKVEFTANMTGTTPSARNDPRGGSWPRPSSPRAWTWCSPPPGGFQRGVYQAAKDAEAELAIGVDSNQNHLHPGTMLTSMVKARSTWRCTTCSEVQPAQLTVLGLKEGGVDVAMDQHNAKLVSADEGQKVDAARRHHRRRIKGRRLHGGQRLQVERPRPPAGFDIEPAAAGGGDARHPAL